jgi:hypothetical protein
MRYEEEQYVPKERVPLDSSKLRDEGRDISDVFREFYDPDERDRRVLKRKKEKRIESKRTDVGL